MAFGMRTRQMQRRTSLEEEKEEECGEVGLRVLFLFPPWESGGIKLASIAASHISNPAPMKLECSLQSQTLAR